mgnify:CR=1 FL=1
MRQTDCIEIKICHCDCKNCKQYKSNKPQNRNDLIMFYVGEYNNPDNNKYEKETITEMAQGFLTPREYIVFLVEISNNGI